MSEVEQTTGLTVPNPNSTRPTTGTSEHASRAETLTNQYPTEKVSHEHVVAGDGGNHVPAPSSVKNAANNEKNDETNVIAVTPAGDADTMRGNGQGGANRTDDDDRYITGFRLFLVFVYVTL